MAGIIDDLAAIPFEISDRGIDLSQCDLHASSVEARDGVAKLGRWLLARVTEHPAPDAASSRLTIGPEERVAED